MALTKVSRGLLSTGIVDNSTTTAITIDSSENVGIGTSSPTSTFRASIKGDYSSIIGGIEFDSGGGDKFTVGHASATSPSATLNVVGAGNLIFKTSNTERMRIDASGNVGIGTSSPDTTLHLQTPSGTKSEINFAQTAVTNYRIGVPASTDALVFTYGASTERMRIDASGNITQTGANSADFLIKAPTDNASLTLQAGASDSGAEGAFVNFLQNTTYKWQMGMNTDNSFRWYNYAASSEAMRIDSSGSLLVGLSSSSNLFAVSSNGVRNDLYVTTGGNVGAYSLGTGTVTCSSGILSFSSDERLKIADGVLSGGLDKVMQIVPQYFYWRDENGDKDQQRPRELGFFAQNIQTICGQEVAPDPHREDLFLGIHDRGVMAVLVKAIQELKEELNTATARITELENN